MAWHHIAWHGMAMLFKHVCDWNERQTRTWRAFHLVIRPAYIYFFSVAQWRECGRQRGDGALTTTTSATTMALATQQIHSEMPLGTNIVRGEPVLRRRWMYSFNLKWKHIIYYIFMAATQWISVQEPRQSVHMAWCCVRRATAILHRSPEWHICSGVPFNNFHLFALE